MNTTSEIQEQIKTARALLDAIERGEEVEVRRDKGPSGIIWQPEPVLGFLNVLSYYRVKPTPIKVPYTVHELLEQGIHYVLSGGDIWTVHSMNTIRDCLTIGTSHYTEDRIERQPEWFACRGYLWSADGKKWNNFLKES